MSISFEKFLEDFREVQLGVLRDHRAEDHGGTHSPLCHIMHRDLGLTETRHENADEMVSLVREHEAEKGINPDDLPDLDADNLDFTTEHEQLHIFLMQVTAEAAMAGLSGSQTLAAMFVIGRRYGMREAAGAFGSFDLDGDLTIDGPPEA